MIRITLKGGDAIERQEGITPLEVARGISDNLAKATFAAKVNGTIVDATTPLDHDVTLELITDKNPESLDIMRHTAAHVMAHAVKNLFPDSGLGFGPAIENGFYYDFDINRPFTQEDLEKIETEMKKIIKADLPLKRLELTFDEAAERLKMSGEKLKLEHLQSLMESGESEGAIDASGEEEDIIEVASDESDEMKITVYEQNGFFDLCRGPHTTSTGKVGAFKLLSSSGAYWKGSENNPMLQRIYATAFHTEKELKKYLDLLEEAKKRDHRKIGRDLKLFLFPEEGAPGMPFFLPNGTIVRDALLDWVTKQNRKRGYDVVNTPHVFRTKIFKTSGHLDNYQENMYFLKSEDVDTCLKPMNCPGHVLLYKSDLRSFRDLPTRYFEFGTCYRNERSGTLTGLMRVRMVTIDDGHIFCTKDQLTDELTGVIDFVHDIYDTFGFEYYAKLATKPKKSIGSDEIWERAENALHEAAARRKLNPILDPGGGAFYGPKIDYFIKDAIGREWQGCTIQLDFNMPERFDLVYFGSDGQKHRPIMIHRAIIGSLERFIGVLTEHTAGDFPLWLAPVQVLVMNITDDQQEYAHNIASELESFGMRVRVDDRNEKVGFKIREAELQKIPYILVVGEREKESGQASVRVRKEGDIGAKMLSEFVMMVKDKILPPD
jgi:threonyl-tRNA synthetase